jgi:hypothetical protein
MAGRRRININLGCRVIQSNLKKGKRIVFRIYVRAK